jgi:hypothetical protein
MSGPLFLLHENINRTTMSVIRIAEDNTECREGLVTALNMIERSEAKVLFI